MPVQQAGYKVAAIGFDDLCASADCVLRIASDKRDVAVRYRNIRMGDDLARLNADPLPVADDQVRRLPSHRNIHKRMCKPCRSRHRFAPSLLLIADQTLRGPVMLLNERALIDGHELALFHHILTADHCVVDMPRLAEDDRRHGIM